MLTFAICDDDVYFLDGLHKHVLAFAAERNLDAEIRIFSTGTEFLSSKQDFDIILMDMRLPEQNGIEIISRLRHEGKRSQVIFVTSYKEFAVQAFDLDAVHYLVKPVSEQKLYRALDKALHVHENTDSKTLIISKGNSTSFIYIRDIIYCEAIDHKILIHTADSVYGYIGTLTDLLQKLDDRFFRCHRSYVVNLGTVVSKNRDSATVISGDQILVSRRKQAEFSQILLTYFRKGMTQ